MRDWKHWKLEVDEASATLWIDVPGQSQNVFSDAVLSELDDVLTALEEETQLACVFIRSRKPTSFFAGADIREFTAIETREQAMAVSERGQQLFQRIADLKPAVVAVIQGACLGGGLEMALACDYRVAVDDPSTRLGLPETELGILPGWGGTQRLPPLVGMLQAIGMILQARKLPARGARKAGLVDLVCSPADVEMTVDKLKEKLTADGTLGKADVQRTWLGWFFNETSWGRSLAVGGTEKKIARQTKHYPALGKALQAIRLSRIDQAKGFEFERQAIADLLFTPTCQNLVRLFLLREKARSVATWTSIENVPETKTLAVLGGGTMGAGIAQLAAKTGLGVVLKEIDESAMHAAEERIEEAHQALVSRGRLTTSQATQQKQAIQFTTEWSQLEKADVVVEAVPESIDLKKTVFQETAKHCPQTTVLASNTSALSVTEIATAVDSPARIGGLHFFNPVHRMDLVEVIQAEQTDESTMAQLVQLSRKLGKTPVVVKDSPGFIVNRILMPYLDEAVKLAVERTARGQDLSVIDLDMKRFGMPMGPLELLDQVGLDVAAHVADSMTVVFGDESLTATIMKRFLDEGRMGRKSGNGFYSYPAGKRGQLQNFKELLGGLDIDLPEEPSTPFNTEYSIIQQRLVFAMVNEAGRCLAEEIVAEDWAIDLAMVLGTGFAPFRGGPLAFARQFEAQTVHDTLRALAGSYGPRFEPADCFGPTQHA